MIRAARHQLEETPSHPRADHPQGGRGRKVVGRRPGRSEAGDYLEATSPTRYRWSTHQYGGMKSRRCRSTEEARANLARRSPLGSLLALHALNLSLEHCCSGVNAAENCALVAG